MKKFLIVILILFLFFSGYIIYNHYNEGKIPVLKIEEEKININKLYTYGTHLNLEGSISDSNNVDFILYNGEFKSYNINKTEDGFNFSKYVNDGLYLEDIPRGDYFLFLRKKYKNEKNEDDYKYYALVNKSSYESTSYYTYSNINNKIVIDSEETYPTMMIHVKENTDSEIYDVVIDPGHGGMDGGASRYGYKESDFTLNIATKIKNKLEESGLKVKLTREEGQLSTNEKLGEYGTHGRAVISSEVHAKYLFSVHMNSNNYSNVHGLEIYTPQNINYKFAKLLANNIITAANIEYSSNKINKIFDGIYTRIFTDSDVENSIAEYKNKNENPYDFSTNSNYYYIIRETGGIVTGAYVDDRNDSIDGNPYVKSNTGTEAYLLELGYISNKSNLDNMITNMDKYVEGIVSSITSLNNK